jgi:hypothetical protein
MGIDQQEAIVVLPESRRPDVTHQQGHAFFDAFGFGMGLQVMTFSCKAHAKKHAAAGTGRGGHLSQDVWVFNKVELGRLPSFLIFCSAALATRQSATAAVAMNTLACSTLAMTACAICSAERTSTRLTPRGVGRLTGPATSVTSAPASCAARATAKPIFPLDKLVMPRTGSMAS